MNPDIHKHAKKWKKGQSGNPKGRPKLPDISELLAKILNGDEDARLELGNLFKIQAIKASQGDTKAFELLLDRGYGKAKQSVDLTSDGEKLAQPIIQILPPSDEVKPETE